MADSRLIELEVKVAYLEKLVAELDGVVREQADKLSGLARDFERQRGQEGVAVGLGDEKPPHY